MSVSGFLGQHRMKDILMALLILMVSLDDVLGMRGMIKHTASKLSMHGRTLASRSSETFIVGGADSYWTIPSNPNFYIDWAASITFQTGDVLQFRRITDGTVYRVTSTEYSTCTEPVTPLSSVYGLAGESVYMKITEAGTWYLMTSVAVNCAYGVKFSLTAVESAGTPSSGLSPPAVSSPGTPSLTPTTPSTLSPPSPPTKNSLGGGTIAGIVAGIIAAVTAGGIAFRFSCCSRVTNHNYHNNPR